MWCESIRRKRKNFIESKTCFANLLQSVEKLFNLSEKMSILYQNLDTKNLYSNKKRNEIN